MDEMIEVAIDSVRVSLMSPQRLVVLRQMDQERFLPIWVGPYEAEAITVALQEVEMVRPLTHDLLKNVFGSFDARIIRVEIVALRDESTLAISSSKWTRARSTSTPAPRTRSPWRCGRTCRSSCIAR
jgi:bifunctional DNase/RNase